MKVLIFTIVVIGTAVGEPPAPSNRYLPSSSSSMRAVSSVSTQYGAPFARNGNGNGNGNGLINGFAATAPSSQYGAPSSQYGAPSNAYNAPDGQYNAPSPQYGAPSSRYGAPGYDRSYDDQSEPANYNFQYDVQEPSYGNDFGHAEARQGDEAQGKYYVLLPDGRRQTVEYTANREGYKPRISYEQTNNGYAGRNGGYNNGGYSNGGYSNGGGNGSGGGYSNGGYSNGNGNGAYSNGNNGNYNQNGGNGGYQY